MYDGHSSHFAADNGFHRALEGRCTGKIQEIGGVVYVSASSVKKVSWEALVYFQSHFAGLGANVEEGWRLLSDAERYFGAFARPSWVESFNHYHKPEQLLLGDDLDHSAPRDRKLPDLEAKFNRKIHESMESLRWFGGFGMACDCHFWRCFMGRSVKSIFEEEGWEKWLFEAC